MMEMLEKTAAALERRHFKAAVFKTAQEAAAFILSDMPDGASVAFGGSVTCQQMGLAQLLRENGHEVLWHWEAAPAERPALLHQAMNATQDGLLVQIDGNGNRVAAMCYGPSTVYVVVGRNKLVSGGYTQAVKRIKEVACPLNARRQGLKTPCAENGSCNPAQCMSPMCHIVASFELAPGGKTTKVLLIDEDLGY